MSVIDRLAAFVRRHCDEHLQWRLQRHDQQARLHHAQRLSEQAVVAELKKHSQQLAHELALRQTQHSTELAMVKTRCQQDLKDYQAYLESLDRLKSSLRASYADLPEAVAFTLHHHAKQLLNQLWEADHPEQKIRYEMQLLQFMTAVHEDSQARLVDGTATLPQRALALMDEQGTD